MRIFCLANNFVGLETVRWLKERNEMIVGLILHPPASQKYGDEIHEVSGVPEENIFYADSLEDPDTLGRIAALKPDIALSIFYGYILRKKFLDVFPKGVINLHPAYLPYNRGAYPNVWSIVEGTPAGATMHFVNERVDTGDIVSRVQVPVSPADTGETLYRKLEESSLALFRETWPSIKDGKIRVIPQVPGEGTFHRIRDVEAIDEIRSDREYTARDLINILRARTFPPYKGAYIVHDGEKIYLRIQLFKDNELTMRDLQ